MLDLVSSIEFTCGIHIHFQIRDVPGPKTVSASDFDFHAPECTTIVFILDATVIQEPIHSIEYLRENRMIQLKASIC